MGALRSLRKAINPAFKRNQLNSAQPVKTPIKEADVLNSLANPSALVGKPLPRDPMDVSQFGPLWALDLQPIDASRRDTGRPEPRITEYEVGANLILDGEREIDWHILRDAARNVDLIRRCIEVRKNRITSLEWAWTVSDEAVQIALDSDSTRKTSKNDVELNLRKGMQGEIGKLTEFWKRPWKGNQFGFRQWVSALLEEYLVIDAVAVYPRLTYGGEVMDFEILDGSTIKPLRDWRGALPQAPYPAYQQILYGYPRGEFTATLEDTPEGTVVPNGYQADQLYYYRNVPRVETPFGLSPVEQALTAARLYLKRQGWLISEYDDGILPLVYFVPGDNTTEAMGEPFTTNKRREWEQAINDEVSGNTRARHRGKVTPPGFQVVMPQNVSEKYKPDYDMYLIRIMSTHMGVTIPSLNLQDSGGLGSTGYHEGLADIEYRLSTLPTIQSLCEIINDLSHKYLGAPKELEFKFLGLEAEDEEAMDALSQSRVASGRMTLNEDRDRQGMPRYDFAEADMPALQTQRGVVFLEGASEQAPPGELVGPAMAPPGAGTGEPPQDAEPGGGNQPPAKPAQKETGPTQKSAIPETVVGRAKKQLEEDYPDRAMDWMDDAKWSGPESVPTDSVDFSNEENWQASSEPDKVHHMEKKIAKGKIKPVILVNRPGSDKAMIVDGHHRSLASRNIGSPVIAYVGRVKTKTGPWDEMHDLQRVGGGTADKSAEAEREVTAYRSWSKRNPEPRRPFSFELLTKSEALGSGIIQPDEIGSRATFKADEQSPKGSAPNQGQPTDSQDWPGWQADQKAAEHWAEVIIAALVASEIIRVILGALKGAKLPTVSLPLTAGETTSVQHWIEQNGVTADTIAGSLTRALEGTWTDGYYIGAVAAQGMATGTAEAAEQTLEDWTVGDADATKLLLGALGDGSGLEEMLKQDKVWIHSIAQTKMKDLAKLIAHGLADGDSPDTIAVAIKGLLSSPENARMIAVTETCRAVSHATRANYKQAGIRQVAWSTSLDDRVCPLCGANESEGPVPIGTPFSSGDLQPPTHPRCRCALVPIV